MSIGMTDIKRPPVGVGNTTPEWASVLTAGKRNAWEDWSTAPAAKFGPGSYYYEAAAVIRRALLYHGTDWSHSKQKHEHRFSISLFALLLGKHAERMNDELEPIQALWKKRSFGGDSIITLKDESDGDRGNIFAGDDGIFATLGKPIPKVNEEYEKIEISRKNIPNEWFGFSRRGVEEWHDEILNDHEFNTRKKSEYANAAGAAIGIAPFVATGYVSTMFTGLGLLLSLGTIAQYISNENDNEIQGDIYEDRKNKFRIGKIIKGYYTGLINSMRFSVTTEVGKKYNISVTNEYENIPEEEMAPHLGGQSKFGIFTRKNNAAKWQIYIPGNESEKRSGDEGFVYPTVTQKETFEKESAGERLEAF